MDLVTSGFATALKIENDPICCTSLSMSEQNEILESSGGYSGSISGAGGILGENTDIGVAGTPMLDVGVVGLNLGLEPTYTQLFTLVNWLLNRNDSKSVTITSGNSSEILYDECYLSGGSISTSENSLVSMTLDLEVYKKPLENGNLGGIPDMVQGNLPFDMSSPETSIVPYWGTKILGLPNDDVLGWNLNFSQVLTKKYYCDGLTKNGERPLPKAIFVGPLQLDLSVDLLVAKNIVNINELLQFKGSGIDVMIYDQKLLKLGKFVTNTTTPVISDMGGKNMVTVSYKIYQLLP